LFPLAVFLFSLFLSTQTVFGHPACLFVRFSRKLSFFVLCRLSSRTSNFIFSFSLFPPPRPLSLRIRTVSPVRPPPKTQLPAPPPLFFFPPFAAPSGNKISRLQVSPKFVLFFRGVTFKRVHLRLPPHSIRCVSPPLLSFFATSSYTCFLFCQALCSWQRLGILPLPPFIFPLLFRTVVE